jgi:hypothetical protein
MVEREPVHIAEIEIAVVAVERKIGVFPTDRTGGVDRILFPVEKSAKE